MRIPAELPGPAGGPRRDGRRGRVAVLIPCYNEEAAVAGVVERFRAELPEAEILVFDNASSDETAARARGAGATVVAERRRGKGYVVQAMFRKVDADIYVMVDGDGTYPASAVASLLEPIRRGTADMVIGSRLHEGSRSQFHALNHLGNRLFRALLNRFFGVRLTDVLSGYRAFSRRLAKGLPLFGGGFETEVEMTIKALDLGFEVEEVPVDLRPRPAGGASKIHRLRDGVLISRTILALCRDYRPLAFFGAAALLLGALGLVPAAQVIRDFRLYHHVRAVTSAIASAALLLAGLVSYAIGLLLHASARRFRDILRRLQLLSDELAEPDGSGQP